MGASKSLFERFFQVRLVLSQLFYCNTSVLCNSKARGKAAKRKTAFRGTGTIHSHPSTKDANTIKLEYITEKKTRHLKLPPSTRLLSGSEATGVGLHSLILCHMDRAARSSRS